MIDSDFKLVLMFDTHLGYGDEEFKLKYNWKFSAHGVRTSTGMVRTSTWQISLAVL